MKHKIHAIVRPLTVGALAVIILATGIWFHAVIHVAIFLTLLSSIYVLLRNADVMSGFSSIVALVVSLFEGKQ